MAAQSPTRLSTLGLANRLVRQRPRKMPKQVFGLDTPTRNEFDVCNHKWMRRQLGEAIYYYCFNCHEYRPASKMLEYPEHAQTPTLQNPKLVSDKLTGTQIAIEVSRLWYKYDLGRENIHLTFGPGALDPEPQVWLDCSDTFAWGTADAEQVVDKHDYDLLVDCVDLITRADQSVGQGSVGWDVAMLYAARRRGIKPFNRRMEKIDEHLRELYDGLGENLSG